MFSVDGEHYLIEPLITGDNTSEHFNQSEQAIPHQLYSLKHSQKHIHRNNGIDSSCAVDTGKSIVMVYETKSAIFLKFSWYFYK